MFYGEEGIKDRIAHLRPAQVITGTVFIPAPDYINGKNWNDELREKNGYTKLESGSWATVINVQDYLDKLEKDILELHQNYKDALARGYEAVNAQEREAYSDPDYLEILRGIKEATTEEEEIRWKLEAARMRVDVWKTEEYTNRLADKAAQ